MRGKKKSAVKTDDLVITTIQDIKIKIKLERGKKHTLLLLTDKGLEILLICTIL